MTDPARLTASEARAEMAAGRLTALDLTRACLARIAARDREVRAWIAVDPNAEAEAARIAPDDPRPLAGIPVAVKDVIDTAGLPTTHNSPLYAGHRPGADAPCVEILRAAGAIVLGKTDTTEFAAAGRNAATANPHDFARTPGGSSAGSAAAVADFHVPLALGTQTGGSTVRPAAFCGVFALKPSWGLISTEGVKRYAVSFDTLGLFARSLDDLLLFAGVYGLPEAGAPAPARPRIALCTTPYADRLAPEARALLDAAPGLLAGAADVVRLDLPAEFERLDALHHTVLWMEGAAAFRNLAQARPTLLHDDFHARAARREGNTVADLFAAYDALADLRRAFERLAAPFDAVLAPAAPGFAPEGRGPGDPVFNALWTAMQLPCLNIPCGGAPLPLGLQLIGQRGGDGRLLAVAARLAPAMAGGLAAEAA